MTVHEVLLSPAVWVTWPPGSIPEYCPVLGPADEPGRVAVRGPVGTGEPVRVVPAVACHATRADAAEDALAHARSSVDAHRRKVQQYSANVLVLERMAAEPEPAGSTI